MVEQKSDKRTGGHVLCPDLVNSAQENKDQSSTRRSACDAWFWDKRVIDFELGQENCTLNKQHKVQISE